MSYMMVIGEVAYRSLVYLHVNAFLEQRNGASQPADTAANDCYTETVLGFLSHVASRWIMRLCPGVEVQSLLSLDVLRC